MKLRHFIRCIGNFHRGNITINLINKFIAVIVDLMLNLEIVIIRSQENICFPSLK